MKKVIGVFVLFYCILLSSLAQVNPNHVWVEGYTRSNGTYVEGYYRTAPNSTNRDNFSTKGNINPYTGKPGWIEPDNMELNAATPYLSREKAIESSNYTKIKEYVDVIARELDMSPPNSTEELYIKVSDTNKRWICIKIKGLEGCQNDERDYFLNLSKALYDIILKSYNYDHLEKISSNELTKILSQCRIQGVYSESKNYTQYYSWGQILN